MGTNYYLSSPPCEKCKRMDEKKHIGKSSMGWQFHFRGYRDEDIVCIQNWRDILANDDKVIVNECNEIIEKQEFWDLIEVKKQGVSLFNVSRGIAMTEADKAYLEKNRCHYERDNYYDEWVDNEGNTFSGSEFS
jgi:hypothetical protein